MKPLNKYPVTFGYLARTTINGRPYIHRGEDRSCPIGTPVVIAGRTIATTGNTGLSTGPHCHLQAGTDIGTQNTVNPSKYWFSPGTVVRLRRTDTGDWGRYVTLRTESGIYTTYAHLQTVNLNAGDIIKKGGTAVTNKQKLTSPPVFDVTWYRNNHADIKRHNMTVTQATNHWLNHGCKEGRQSNANFAVKEYLGNYGDLRRAFGKDYSRAALHWFNSGIKEGRSGRTIKPDTAIKKLQDDLAKVKQVNESQAKEIKRLEAIQGNATRWEKITALLKEILGIN